MVRTEMITFSCLLVIRQKAGIVGFGGRAQLHCLVNGNKNCNLWNQTGFVESVKLLFVSQGYKISVLLFIHSHLLLNARFSEQASKWLLNAF